MQLSREVANQINKGNFYICASILELLVRKHKLNRNKASNLIIDQCDLTLKRFEELLMWVEYDAPDPPQT